MSPILIILSWGMFFGLGFVAGAIVILDSERQP